MAPTVFHSLGPKPGAANTATVNLATGNVSFPINLVSLPGRNGLDFDLAILYNSNVRQVVDTWNFEAPTGVLGLGWSFIQEQIVRNTRGTGSTLDDAYFLASGGTMLPLIRTGSGAEGDTYQSEAYQFWKIRHVVAQEMWVVTKEDGTRYYYGGGVHQDRANSKTSTGDAIEWGIKWGNWIGPSTEAAGQEQFPVAWNLSCIQNTWRDQISFRYQQVRQSVGAGRLKYTQACRVKEIIGATGEKIVCTYGNKAPEEYEKLHASNGTGPDAYQDRLETAFLDRLDLYNETGFQLYRVVFSYGSLGADKLKKRILRAISHTNGAGRPYAPSRSFEYYGENAQEDKVSVAIDRSQLFHPDTGAFYGALKSVTTPEGARIAYRYQEISITGASRNFEILRPENNNPEWVHPRLHWGMDYVLVIWRGAGSKLGKFHASAYQWHGQWIPADLGMLELKDDNIHIEVAGDFFAIVTPGLPQSVHVFSQNRLQPGRWDALSPQTGRIDHFLMASGEGFLALLDSANGKLYRFTRNGEIWEKAEDSLKTGSGTVFALAARNNYVFTVSAAPDNAFKPELLLHYLNAEAPRPTDARETWHVTRSDVDDFFPPKAADGSNSGIRAMAIHASDTFVTLQVASYQYSVYSVGGHHASGTYFDCYRHFVCKWPEDFSAIQTEELGSQIQLMRGERNRVRLTVVDDMVNIDKVTSFSGEKQVHQYLGTRWKSRVFVPHDSLDNNYIGPNSFSTTQSGQAQFWELNRDATDWEAKFPPYADGNPTFWEKVWETFITIEWILTLPFAEIGFLIDIAAFALDLVISAVHEQGVSIDRQGRFFTGDNTVYYKNPDGSWRALGKLLTSDQDEHLIDSGVWPITFEQYQKRTLAQSTQNAQDFIAFVIKDDQYQVTHVRGGGPFSPPPRPSSDPGFPKYVSKIQLLKNGQLRGSAIKLDDTESVKRSDDDESSLVGPNAFVAYKGGSSLKVATSLVIHRVINDGIEGALKDYAVCRVAVNDGYEDTYTHYEYDDIKYDDKKYDDSAARMASTGANALYNKVTSIFSGNSATAVRSNGYTESYFYVGSTGPLPHLPPAPAYSLDPSQCPSLVKTAPYHTKIIDGSGLEVATTTQYWRGFATRLIRNRMGYYLRPVRTESSVNGVKTVLESSYLPPTLAGAGIPDKTLTYNFDASGNEQRIESSYTQALVVYADLSAQHVISPVVRTETQVNGISTGILVSSWQKFPVISFTFAPQGGLPPDLFAAEDWHISARDTLSTSAEMAFPRGVSEQEWTAPISPVTLRTDYAGKLLFDYEGSASTVGGEMVRAQLEAWLGGSKIWSDTVGSHSSGSAGLDLPPGHGPLEWRVNCVARPLPNTDSRFHARISVSVRSMRIEAAANAHWAPARTFRAKRAVSRPVGDPPDASNRDWLQISGILVRDPVHGVVTETRGLTGTTQAIVLDAGNRFPVATFVSASVAAHEAGYYGFEDYENAMSWQITGSRQKQSAFTGTTALSGPQAQIMPNAFVPRPSSTPYLVSAWFKPRAGGNGGRIGFGSTSKAVSSSDPRWQYVEFVIPSALASHKPFASCDGEVDNFRFGPVDAPFSATIYEPTYKIVTATLGTNGEVSRYFYDDLQRPVCVTGPDEQIVQLHSQRYSRHGDTAFQADNPNQTLVIVPRNGGEYHDTLAALTTRKGPQQFTKISSRSYGLRFRAILSSPNPASEGGRDAYEIQAGNIKIAVCVSRGEIKFDVANRSPKNFPVHLAAPGDALSYGAMLLVFDKTITVLLNDNLIFSEVVADFTGGTLSITPGPNATIDFRDISVFYDPIINLSYADGLGRSLQTQTIDGSGTGMIVSQTLYDGWGHPAVQTKPMRYQGIDLRYRADVVATFDWSSGEMRGAVSDYYHTAAAQGQDHLFPYINTVREPNPLARVIEIGAPGFEFKAGSPTVPKTEFGRTGEATALLATLGLTSQQEHFPSITTWRPLSKATRTPTTRVLDAQRNVVAVRHGTGNNAVLSTNQIECKVDGTLDLISYPPNFHRLYGEAKAHYRSLAKTSFLGRTTLRQDCDRATRHFVYDPAGRARFMLDAVGATEFPNRVLYWKYDALGRVVEDGFVLQEWNEEQLQSYADEQPAWPAPPATWRHRYGYDFRPNNDVTNVKGRLHQIVTRDDAGREIREFYVYDVNGNVIVKQLQVDAYDVTLRTTQYEYDRLGNVVKVVYPHPPAGASALEVHYHYNALGQLGSVGTANQPTCYAAYEYDIDGSLKAEWLNNKALRCDFSYDFQGRLVAIRDTIAGHPDNPNPLFSETLSYRDAAGNFRDGNIAQATSAGTALGSEHSSAYEYDEYGRLTSAKASPHAGWNIEGITYDANSNITGITTGSVSSEYGYRPGTNQIAKRKAPAGETVYVYDANGRLVEKVSEAGGEREPHAGNPHVLFDPKSKYPELARLLAAAANGNDDMLWQAADQETWKILAGDWWDSDDVDLAIIAANVPCADLEAVDQLWVKYSEGKFGFSVQRDIYLESGGSNNFETWHDFGQRVGWCRSTRWIPPREVIFHNWALRGHLPVINVLTVMERDRNWYPALTGLAGLFARLEACRGAAKYPELARLLAAAANGDEAMWQLADQETWNILLRSTNRDTTGRWWNLPSEGDGADLAIIAKVPCTDLEGIDQLWVKYSEGKFGFSAQRNIYLDSGAPKNPNEPGWRDFGKRVGWYRGDSWIVRQDVKFASSAPRGYLPVIGVFTVLSASDWSVALTGLAGLFARVETCLGAGAGELEQSAGANQPERISYEPFTALTSEIHKGDIITTFSYNGSRQRVLKTTCRDGDRTNRRQTLYIHGMNSYPLTETSQAGSVCYIYGLTGLVAMHEGFKLCFFLKDHLGSTRVVLNPTNGVEAKFDYEPFGALRAANSSPKQAMARFRYLYTGQEFDWETGLYNYRARLYDSDLARFYSPDPLNEFFSPYVFVGNNPINRVDPSGMISLLGGRLLVGAISTVVYTILGVGLGAGIGAIVGAAQGKTDEQTRQGAIWGAVAGLTLGGLRIFAETIAIPLYRNFRGAANALHPVILYNEHQTTEIIKFTYKSGRVGAEMIAEAQHIPRGRWNDHLISFQELETGRQFPNAAAFNRRIIAVAHGDTSGGVETQLGLAFRDQPNGFLSLINKNEPLTQIDRIDLCVCHADRTPVGGTSFAQGLRRELNQLNLLNQVNPNITGWASDLGVSPVHPLGYLGTILEEGGSSKTADIFHAIFPIGRPPGGGAAMPAPNGAAAGMWRQF